MDWIGALSDKEYVLADVLPGIIRAAVIEDSSQAMYLLASVLLMRSAKDRGKVVPPLQVIYDPAEALCDAFPGAREIWEKSGELDLLCQVPELLLNRKREILVNTIEQIKAKHACRCRFHFAPDGSDDQKIAPDCVIPSILLWERIAKLLGTCSSCVNQDLVGSRIFTMNGDLRRVLTTIECKMKVPDSLSKQFGSNAESGKKSKYELSKNAVIAPVHQQNAAVWMVTDYREHKNNDSEHDKGVSQEESDVRQYFHYFIVATDRTIQVHHHMQGDIVNDLDKIIELLVSKDEDIAGTPWWAEAHTSEAELREWSRFRAVFFFSLVKRIVQNTAALQTDNTQSRLLGEADVTGAINDMQACGEQAGHEKISKERLDSLGADVDILSGIQSARALSDKIRELFVSQEGYPALEKCVMHCVCRLIDLVTQHTTVSGQDS